jgi:hypothetical protein
MELRGRVQDNLDRIHAGGTMSNDYTLAYGTHARPEDGRCAMEWVSHIAGEPHGDSPACVSPVLRAFCVALNDALEDAPRQRLRPYLTRTIGTVDDGLDERRAWMAMDWLIRTYTPTWLSAAELDDMADRLRSLPEVSTSGDLRDALQVLRIARQRSREQWGSPTAWLTPRGAARIAAREAAWSSAGAAAWAAARAGVGDITGDQARAAARAAAGDAAAAISRAARASAGRAAASQSARESLAPTQADVQASLFALLDRMLPTVPLTLPELGGARRQPATFVS